MEYEQRRREDTQMELILGVGGAGPVYFGPGAVLSVWAAVGESTLKYRARLAGSSPTQQELPSAEK